MAQHKASCLLPFVLALILDAGAASPQFAVQDLGPVEATFVSNDGRVLGDEGIGTWWLWNNGERVPLPLDGACVVNRSGCVAGHVYAGSYMSAFGEPCPYYGAALWQDGVRTALGTLGGRGSFTTSINASQVVVGLADDPGNVRHPFIWRRGVMAAIRVNFPAGGAWTFDLPLRITDDERIYGSGTLLDAPHAVQLAPVADGSYDLTDLGRLAGLGAPSVSGFNDFGWAIGCADRGGLVGPRVEAFVLKDGGTTWLGNLGADGSYARGVNNAGDVVGTSNSRSYRAFLWREGTIYDLNSCVSPDSGWVLVEANAINDSGQIVGHGILNGTGTINQDGIVNGGHRAFLLNPLPGTDLGLRVRVLGPVGQNQWLLGLVQQPTPKISFVFSADLVHWSRIAHTNSENGFLLEGGRPEMGFFRAVFGL